MREGDRVLFRIGRPDKLCSRRSIIAGPTARGESHFSHHRGEGAAAAGLLSGRGGCDGRDRSRRLTTLNFSRSHLPSSDRSLWWLRLSAYPASSQKARPQRYAHPASPERTDHLGFAWIRHHRELGIARRTAEEHAEGVLPGLLYLLKVHVGFTVEAQNSWRLLLAGCGKTIVAQRKLNGPHI